MREGYQIIRIEACYGWAKTCVLQRLWFTAQSIRMKCRCYRATQKRIPCPPPPPLSLRFESFYGLIIAHWNFENAVKQHIPTCPNRIAWNGRFSNASTTTILDACPDPIPTIPYAKKPPWPRTGRVALKIWRKASLQPPPLPPLET